MKKDNWFQRLCYKVTGHRLNRKYKAKIENRVYCQCWICGKRLWMEIKLPVAGEGGNNGK